MPNPFYIQTADIPGAINQGISTSIQRDQLQQQYDAQRAMAERQQQMQIDLAAVANNPNAGPAEYGKLMLAYPEMSDKIKAGYDVLSPDMQQSLLSEAMQVDAAVQSGRADVAAGILRQKAEALRNSGDDQKAKMYEDKASLIEMAPANISRGATAAPLIAILGADKYKNLIEAQGMQAEQPYKAQQAEVGARYAEEEKVLDLQKKAEDAKKAKIDQKLSVIDAKIKIAKSDEERQRLQMDRDKLSAEQGKMTAEAQSKSQQAIDKATTGISTVNELLKHPGLTSGTGFGSDWQAWFSGSDAADFRAALEPLKSQQFLSSISEMKGTGALSDAEGARLETAIASLSTAQSDKQMVKSLTTIRDTLRKAQQKQIASGNAPMEGGVVVAKHPRYGNVYEGDVNRVMAENPGATREQVIRFLTGR